MQDNIKPFNIGETYVVLKSSLEADAVEGTENRETPGDGA